MEILRSATPSASNITVLASNLTRSHQESCFSGARSFLFQQQGALLFYLFEFFVNRFSNAMSQKIS